MSVGPLGMTRSEEELRAENARLREALTEAREIIVREFGERDPLKPWDFIDEVLSGYRTDGKARNDPGSPFAT